AAVSGRQAGLFAPRPRVVVNNSTATATGATLEQPKDVIKPLDLPLDDKAFAAFSADNFARNQPKPPEFLGFKAQAESISLEPTTNRDQKARPPTPPTGLRGINEGNDPAASPGYALTLVPTPVSGLPGSKPRQGYGAEVTMTLTPYLSDELLPTTFRNLVLN